MANNVVHTYEELSGDLFYFLPQGLRNALKFVGYSLSTAGEDKPLEPVLAPFASLGCWNSDD
jgi:hypothetical protein